MLGGKESDIDLVGGCIHVFVCCTYIAQLATHLTTQFAPFLFFPRVTIPPDMAVRVQKDVCVASAGGLGSPITHSINDHQAAAVVSPSSQTVIIYILDVLWERNSRYRLSQAVPLC